MSDKMPELPLPVGDVIVFDPIHQMTRLEQAHGEYFTEAQLHAYARQYAQQWREDAERLDFLIRHRARISFGDSDDPRQVIDAARAAREGGES